MAESKKNYFEELYALDMSEKAKEKNGFTYTPWTIAWAEVKKKFPTATNHTYEREDGRPWFDDGKSGWVKVGVTIEGIEHIEHLPILNLRNSAIKAEDITSMEANKAIKRALTKACADHGCGLHVYEGEDIPEEARELLSLQEEVFALSVAKSKISDEFRKKVGDLVKAVEVSGDPREICDVEVLKTLKGELMALRKSKAKKED